ncbi:IS110 family transposase [Georgenia sp. TF02-10]|uniref:IS110 family transposase n=1 Tax=Georgenia sp. TF02-10 TaxID=2917725 RepID=UPI00352CE651
MASAPAAVIAGVDTHADTHHVAVVAAATGTRLGDAKFPTTEAGYGDLLRFITSHGQVTTVGIEGTNSYGAGLSRHLRSAGVKVAEVLRPARQVRRRHGKSDPIDAYAAASAVLAGDRLPAPKAADGDVEAIRALHLARRSAVKARANTQRQIKSLLVTAPEKIRAQVRNLTDTELLTRLAATRPAPATAGVEAATLTALRHLARRHRYLTEEITELEADLDTLLRRAAPALLATKGIGTVTAAQLLVTAGDNPDRLTSEGSFAALCGAAPIPASSGKTVRYRLNRGGDRHANAALYRIVLVRMSCDPRTKAYVAKRTTEGKDTKEIIRCLKRTIAREVYHLLTHPAPVPRTEDLRPLRNAKHITLQAAADHFGTWPTVISRLERGLSRNDTLADAYRHWLHAA